MHRDAASRAVRRRLLTRLFPFSFFLFPFRARQAAPQPPGARPVTTVRKLLVVGGLCVLAVGLGPSYNALARAAAPVMGLSFGWTRALIFLLAGVLLCAWTPRACGWRLGETARWQRHGLAIAAVWVTTPLATIWLYAPFTDRPFCGYGIQFWLVETVAQELIFPGFVYARLVELWGEEREGWRGAFSPPMLILAVLFASWHWYNITFFTGAYVTAQIIYTFIGGWLVYQTRRWTGSLLPGIASHVVVNYLGCVM
jgi:membrane protease YdiL (CAAX protease family)